MAYASLEAQVVINEVLASNRSTNEDEDGDSSDWLELHNRGPGTVDLKGFALSDDRSEPQKWLFPWASLAAGSYLLVWCSNKDRTEVPAERITEPNSPLPFDADLISLGAEWLYLTGAPTDPGPPLEWKSPGFDDSGWYHGKPGFGFGNDPGIVTPLTPGIGAVFLRRTFQFQPGRRNLVLKARYDDGFVAYLNGVRVAAANFPEGEEPAFASKATRSHAPAVVERFDLTSRQDLLQPGENLFAIALLNLQPTNNDLVLFPELGNVPPPLHTSFKISAEGGPVLLIDAAGRIQDEVELPPQSPDHSYARSPDGSGPFLYHRTPTPQARNEGPASERPLLVADTKFSQDRGLHDAPFAVAITTDTEGGEIRYTLDGTVPEESSGVPYTGPITLDRTTTLRARAFKPGFEPTNTDTHTYVFLDDIVRQDFQSVVAAGFPGSWGAVPADYGMDPDIVGPNDRFGGIYAATIRDDLRSLPTLSIVMNRDDLFGPQGIYTHSEMRGTAWERPASAEWISPSGGSEFQVNCGIRVQGGYFRQHAATRKHSLRLLFRSRYGSPKLKHALFGDGAADEFDTITLRSGANDGYSWDAARLTEQYTRDEFGRSLQRAAGNAAAHGVFAHLYLNGVYWGLYNAVERPDHAFSSSYYGGDKADWDAIHDGVPTGGNSIAWNAMIQKTLAARTALATYLELEGRNPEGARDPALPHLLDVPNYADYLIVNLWGGNWDWPWKNWWAGRDRTERSTGFKFYCWDYENTIGNNRERSPLSKNALLNDFSGAGPPHQNLRTNPEYKLEFADRAQRLLFNGGVLTPQSLILRYEALAALVERAIVCESARWGDQHFNPPLTLKEWLAERDWVLGTYLPQRSSVVLQQFRGAGLYPVVASPLFSRHGGLVPRGFRVLAGAPDGAVYYTTDGSDPRLPGGATSPLALVADAGRKVVVLAEQAEVRWHVPADDGLGPGWTAADFDDSAWRQGRLAVGFEKETGYEGLIATDTGEAMHQVNASIYLRCAFEVQAPSSLAFLTLRMKYDDGYIAYLNGVRVAERAAPAAPRWNSVATAGRADTAAVVYEAVDLSGAASLLKASRNVLAIHGLNFRAADADFLIQAELVATDPTGAGITIERSTRFKSRALVNGEWSALNEAVFIVDSNIPLRVTEVMYHPPEPAAGVRYDSDEFEFLELRNLGAGPLDLSQVRLRGGVQFDFAESDVEVLAAGEYLLLVENLKAFRSAYDVSEVKIAGEYEGRLSNGGEALVLEGFLGEPILQLEYDAAWHPETDGEGRSLVIADPFLPREAWNDARSWRPSRDPGGSPGRDEPGGGQGGRQRQGDANQDGRLNVTDAILLLLRLFHADHPLPSLPCAGDSVAGGGNRMLHDTDGNGSVNLTDAFVILAYLFQRGAPPALGAACVPIEGCPQVCGG